MNERTRLLELWNRLNPADRNTLLRFAEFLDHSTPPVPLPVVTAPLPIPRPESETAVAALKRLKSTYPMIEADRGLLEEASQLLMRKIMGEPDPVVITALEELFARRHQRWREGLVPAANAAPPE